MREPQEYHVEKKVLKLIIDIEDNIRNFLNVIINSNEPDVSNLMHSSKYKALKSYCDSRVPKFKEELRNNNFIFEDGYYSYTIINKLEEVVKQLINIKLTGNLNNLEGLLDETLNVAIKINDISKEISMINISINRVEGRINLIHKNIELCSEDLKKTRLEIENKDSFLINYFDKIDILIYIEKFLLNFELNSFSGGFSELKINENNSKKTDDLEDDLKYILGELKKYEAYKKLLFVSFKSLSEIKDKISSIKDLSDTKLIVNIFSSFKKLIKSNSPLFDGAKEKESIDDQQSKAYIRALRLYEIEKKGLYESTEIKLLTLKIDNISLIDKSITHKNEFYNEKIEKLLKIEKGFIRLFDYYSGLSEEKFTKKEWSNIESSKVRIEYIISIFKNKEKYKFFLLLDDRYIDDTINYLDFKLIDAETVSFEDEKSQKIIMSFHSKASNPDTFIKIKREDWSTPLFWFNANYYALRKDYNDKYDKIENLDNKIDEYIKDNGDYEKRFGNFLENIGNETKRAKRKVSDIVCQYNQVALLLNNVESSEKFIKEIEGLYINNETRTIYAKVYNDEIKIANSFRRIALIIYLILGFFAFASLSFLILSDVESEWLKRFSDTKSMLIKLPLILTLVFIGVYLSREGDKHRRFANQARQTMNELHAFTSYSTDIQDKVVEIKTKLADKYFGVTLYEPEKAMSSDMDVLKTLVEQTKVTTDLIKTLQNTAVPIQREATALKATDTNNPHK